MRAVCASEHRTCSNHDEPYANLLPLVADTTGCQANRLYFPCAYSPGPYIPRSPRPEDLMGEDLRPIPASASVKLSSPPAHPLLKSVSTVVLGLAVLLCVSSCSIVKSVNAVQPGVTIDKIYVLRNKNVHMEGLHPEVMEQLKTLGFQVESFDSAPTRRRRLYVRLYC